MICECSNNTAEANENRDMKKINNDNGWSVQRLTE